MRQELLTEWDEFAAYDWINYLKNSPNISLLDGRSIIIKG